MMNYLIPKILILCIIIALSISQSFSRAVFPQIETDGWMEVEIIQAKTGECYISVDGCGKLIVSAQPNKGGNAVINEIIEDCDFIYQLNTTSWPKGEYILNIQEETTRKFTTKLIIVN